jgi:hypothetical protein
MRQPRRHTLAVLLARRSTAPVTLPRLQCLADPGDVAHLAVLESKDAPIDEKPSFEKSHRHSS